MEEMNSIVLAMASAVNRVVKGEQHTFQRSIKGKPQRITLNSPSAPADIVASWFRSELEEALERASAIVAANIAAGAAEAAPIEGFPPQQPSAVAE